MFSFLKDSWGHSYSEDSEEDGEGEGQDDKEELYTRKFSSAEVTSPTIEAIPSPPSSSASSASALPLSSSSQERIKELEEQNSKFLNQISDLQRILTTKSSLYLEYKDRYEVSKTHSLTLHHHLPAHSLTHTSHPPPSHHLLCSLPSYPIPILLIPPSHLLSAVSCDLEK